MSDLHSRATDAVDRALAQFAAQRPGAHVVDIGGGSGTRAVPLAQLGCRVTVVDTSADALAMLRRRAVDAGVQDLVEGLQADADALGAALPAESADLLLCHRLLESLDHPAAAVAAMAQVLRPGGVASVLVAGRHAALIVQALAGRFDAATTLASDADGRFGDTDPLRRRFDVDGLTAVLESAGLTVESVTGIGVVSGLISGAVRQAHPGADSDLARLETLIADRPPLRDIAAELHALARKPG